MRIAPLKAGDGVVFDAAGWRSPEEPEEGGRIFQVARCEGKLELRFGNGVLNASRIRRGDLIWRTHDPNLDKVVRPYLEAATPLRKQPVRVKVTAREGQALQTEWSVEAGERDGGVRAVAGKGARIAPSRRSSCASSWDGWETRRMSCPHLNSKSKVRRSPRVRC